MSAFFVIEFGIAMKKTVLFLCTANSARSQLAEALFNQLAGEHFVAYSAGMQPTEIDSRVFTVLNERGVDSRSLYSKNVADLKQQKFDFVITLCDNAKDECAVFGETDALMHWDFSDPKQQQGEEPFFRVLKGLEERIKLFLLLNGESSNGTLAPTMLMKLMSDSTRLKILMLLEDEKVLSVSDLTAALKESQPKISRHLAQLRDSGFLQDERDGLWIFYRFSDHLPAWLLHTIQAIRNGNPGIINQEIINLKRSERKRRYSK